MVKSSERCGYKIKLTGEGCAGVRHHKYIPTLQSLESNALANMNVFSLDLNVAMESNSFNEAGNLFRRRGAIYENALLEKHRSDVAFGTSSRKGSSEVL